MITEELIRRLKEMDPSGKRVVRIDATGFRGGPGSSWGRLPSVDSVSNGIDHDSGNILLQLDKRVKAR